MKFSASCILGQVQWAWRNFVVLLCGAGPVHQHAFLQNHQWMWGKSWRDQCVTDTRCTQQEMDLYSDTSGGSNMNSVGEIRWPAMVRILTEFELALNFWRGSLAYLGWPFGYKKAACWRVHAPKTSGADWCRVGTQQQVRSFHAGRTSPWSKDSSPHCAQHCRGARQPVCPESHCSVQYSWIFFIGQLRAWSMSTKDISTPQTHQVGRYSCNTSTHTVPGNRTCSTWSVVREIAVDHVDTDSFLRLAVDYRVCCFRVTWPHPRLAPGLF